MKQELGLLLLRFFASLMPTLLGSEVKGYKAYAVQRLQQQQ